MANGLDNVYKISLSKAHFPASTPSIDLYPCRASSPPQSCCMPYASYSLVSASLLLYAIRLVQPRHHLLLLPGRQEAALGAARHQLWKTSSQEDITSGRHQFGLSLSLSTLSREKRPPYLDGIDVTPDNVGLVQPPRLHLEKKIAKLEGAHLERRRITRIQA